MTSFTQLRSVKRLYELAEEPLDLTNEVNFTPKRIDSFMSEGLGLKLFYAGERVSATILDGLDSLAQEMGVVEKMKKVQAAIEADCERLYSEDLSAGQKFGSVVVVNLSAHGQGVALTGAGEGAPVKVFVIEDMDSQSPAIHPVLMRTASGVPVLWFVDHVGAVGADGSDQGEHQPAPLPSAPPGGNL